MRRLAYVVVELGPCEHCRMDAGAHSIEGLCHPQSRPAWGRVEPTDRRPCYRGETTYAFVDVGAGEGLALAIQREAASAT